MFWDLNIDKAKPDQHEDDIEKIVSAWFGTPMQPPTLSGCNGIILREQWTTFMLSSKVYLYVYHDKLKFSICKEIK